MIKMKKDTLVLDRGESEKDRFYAIVDDKNVNIVNDDGVSTDVGRQMIASLMDNEAIKNGAKVIDGSTCAYGGDTDVYGNDRVYAFNAGDHLMLDDIELQKFLIENNLVEVSK